MPFQPFKSYVSRFFLPFILMPLCGTGLCAQTTNISIGAAVLQPSVKRFGINLGSLTNYDSGQITNNLVMQNPGFEGQIWNSTIRCASGTSSTCTDDDQYSSWPAGFWNGATYQVFYGTASGRSGTIASWSASGNGQGGTLNFADSGVAPAVGDYVIVRKAVPGGSSQGWWPSTWGAGTITDNFTDLPPGTLGKQTAVLTAPTVSDAASLAGYFDSLSGHTFIQLNGTYQIQFKAKATGGSNQVNVSVTRFGVATYFYQTVSLTNSWNTYNLTFAAAENGSDVGTVGVTFGTAGADSLELDDVSLTKTSGNPANTTEFRDEVLTALQMLQPGVLRYWANGGQLGDTLDNLIASQFGRQRPGYSAWSTESDQISFGLHDFLVLCNLVGAEPWFVVPSTFSTTDASNLIEYLAGSSATPYGAKRAALGQTAPWAQVFKKIHLEFGNEAWNGTFKGGSIEYSAPYGAQAQTIFAAMRSNAAYVPADFDLVLGGQAAAPGRNLDIQNRCNNNDSFALAPYTMNTVSSYTDNESLYGSTFAEPEQYMSASGTAEGLTPGEVYQNYQAIQSSTHPVPLSFYETNLSTTGGSITQQALNTYASSLGAGLMVVDTMLQSLRTFGVVNQELFALPQYEFQRPDGSTVYLWGAVVDMGVTNRKRPQYLALQLANNAISNGAAMLQTVHSGADPTWNQPLVNTVQLNGAHYLQSFAFAQGNNLSTVVFNLHRTATLPVTFSGANAPSGIVQMQQLTSANPTDNNENANVVAIAPSTLTGFNPAAGLSLPPYSMTVLTWTAGTYSPAPVISAVTVSALTSTSATVTWTTDQASTSQVRYGTSKSYGSSSMLNSAPVISHSVTLTGLTPSSAYDYEAVSANSAGASSTSANFSFSTPATPSTPLPRLSAVAFWGITGSAVTISWSTNVPSTTYVEYGVSQALGQLSPVQLALSSNHGITLTGLAAGTTYYFVAQSAGASGSVGSSTMYSFTTLHTAPPTISGIVVTPGVNNAATIGWTASTPVIGQVVYGTTTSYGKWSAATPALTQSPECSLTSLPAGLIHFQILSTDAYGNRSASPDYTFTEP
jgi:hypothetical protein